MTILRRNLVRLWILCGLLWLAFVVQLVIRQPPRDDAMNVVAAFALLPPIILLLVGLGLTRIWERFGEPHWRQLPLHVRRGLTRLYLVVSVPWVAWYGYQILDAAQHSGYASQRAMSHDFWLLLIVPIGGPILLVVVFWVVAGFRKSTPGWPTQGARDSAAQSRTGPTPSPRQTASSSRGPTLLDATEAVLKQLDLDRLMNDESFQNNKLPETIRSAVLSGADCDEIPGAVGEFGRDPRNPIPVNGPLGEVIYLSNLSTMNYQQIMFHRLGSVLATTIDAYETVSLDGAIWDIVFLDMYHPRKSRIAPARCKIGMGGERRPLFGANEFVASFPEKLPEAISTTTERLLGIPMRPPQVRKALERIKFTRPTAHQAKLKAVGASLIVKVPVSAETLKQEKRPRPFYINVTSEERREWFARTPPWNRIRSSVIDAVLAGITDEVLLEAFIVTSMELGLAARYAVLGEEGDSPTVIRAQVSQILCERGHVVVGTFIKALEANQRETAGALAALATNTFGPAIALAKNQIAGYIGMARLYGLVGKRPACHEWAERGLAELGEMRRDPAGQALCDSTMFPPDMLDQMERQLRSFLEH